MVDLTQKSIQCSVNRKVYKSRQNGPQLFMLLWIGFGSNEQIHKNDILPNLSPVHIMLVAARKRCITNSSFYWEWSGASVLGTNIATSANAYSVQFSYLQSHSWLVRTQPCTTITSFSDQLLTRCITTQHNSKNWPYDWTKRATSSPARATRFWFTKSHKTLSSRFYGLSVKNAISTRQ